MLRLDSVWLRILGNDHWNARLVEELRKRRPKELEQAPERRGGSWGNSNMDALRVVLKESSFKLAKGTSHEVRITLGDKGFENIVVRIRGPRFSAFTDEFVLSERV